MPFVIGVVGESLAGKDTFVGIFSQTISGEVEVVTFSDILFETLELWGIEATRDHLQRLPEVMDGEFGDGALTRAVARRVRSSPAKFVILNGIRKWSYYELLRSFERNKLVYVTADVEVRWARALEGGGKSGESELSLEEFVESDEANTEAQIPKIGERADVIIRNNGSLNSFWKKCNEKATELFVAYYG